MASICAGSVSRCSKFSIVRFRSVTAVALFVALVKDLESLVLGVVVLVAVHVQPVVLPSLVDDVLHVIFYLRYFLDVALLVLCATDLLVFVIRLAAVYVLLSIPERCLGFLNNGCRINPRCGIDLLSKATQLRL